MSSLIAKNSGGSTIAPLEEGVYTGICTGITDLGLQKNQKFEKVSHRIMFTWSIVGETIELRGEQVNRELSREYTLSLHERSGLRKDLQAWRGKAFTDKELEGFDIANVLGVPCQLQVVHEERNGSTYARIGAIMAMPKGLPKPDKNDYALRIFDFEDAGTWYLFGDLPEWIQDKIRGAENYPESELEGFVNGREFADVEDGDNDDKLPF